MTLGPLVWFELACLTPLQRRAASEQMALTPRSNSIWSFSQICKPICESGRRSRPLAEESSARLPRSCTHPQRRILTPNYDLRLSRLHGYLVLAACTLWLAYVNGVQTSRPDFRTMANSCIKPLNREHYSSN